MSLVTKWLKSAINLNCHLYVKDNEKIKNVLFLNLDLFLALVDSLFSSRCASTVDKSKQLPHPIIVRELSLKYSLNTRRS